MKVTHSKKSNAAYYRYKGVNVAKGPTDIALVWSERSTVGHAIVRKGEPLFDLITQRSRQEMTLPCELVDSGKFRNGAERKWCTTHQCAYGTKADLARNACSSAEIPVSVMRFPPQVSHKNIAIWYAAKPTIFIGDKRLLRALQEGIHVHTYDDEGNKKLDATFRALVTSYNGESFAVTPTVARSRALALIEGTKQDALKHALCGRYHNDLGHFGAKPHKMHLCGFDGRPFWAKQRNTANSLAALPTTPQTKETEGHIDIDSDRYQAVAVWPTTPAVYSTVPQTKDGFHVHCWQGGDRVVDDTFASVCLDGVVLQRDEIVAASFGKAQWKKENMYTQIIH